jgi:ubiquitin carboxyl-terminal hydrolase 2
MNNRNEEIDSNNDNDINDDVNDIELSKDISSNESSEYTQTTVEKQQSNLISTTENKYRENYENGGLTGLANLGNTCFINSTIQCLSHTYELNDFLNKETYKQKINKSPDSLLLIEWDNLRKLMWSENCTIQPGGFISSIQKMAKIKDKHIFTGFAQNDLPEFLLFLIDCFHNGIKRKVEMKISGKPKNEKDNIAFICYEMWKQLYTNEYSEILNLFYGTHVSRLTDPKTGEILSQRPEPFFLINLPIPSLTESKKTVNILDCFNLYTKKERLEGDNQWYNEDTKQKQDVDKNIIFFKLPDVLVLDLKRFSNSIRKNQTLVDFPIDKLDLCNYVHGYDTHSYLYELYGICNHSGSTIGGHYTAYVRNANGKWYHFNDTHISEVSNINSMITPKAYCLFYRKKIFNK